MINAYWWEPKGLSNFGDVLNQTILKKLEVEHQWANPGDADLVMVGSVLEHLPPKWSGIVCGAGKLREESVVDLSRANVLALRGKLTAANVRGLGNRQPVLGDPGLLASQLVRQNFAKHDLGVLPHWSDTELANRFPYGHVINPLQSPEAVISEISQCKRLVSSSLHGLIIADSYGIPRQAELFAQSVREGGDFKFRDYASVYDDHPHFGEMWLAPREVVERIQRELRRALREALGLIAEELGGIEDVETWRNHDDDGPQISIIVPFRDDGEHRTRVWHWLRQYWHANLSSVEIVQGRDDFYPFSKSQAVNEAACRARGRVFVILDADAYLDADVVQCCADEIDAALAFGGRKWFMPYSKLFRLTKPATLDLLKGCPTDPYSISSPPPADWVEVGAGNHSHNYGHKYGAMIQIMPREAFFEVGGMDPRFRSWGSEDASMLRSLDTLYCQHENTPNDICHLWHVRPGGDWMSRRWVGQDFQANSRLAQRYSMATGEAGFMRALVDEHPLCDPAARRNSWHKRWWKKLRGHACRWLGRS